MLRVKSASRLMTRESYSQDEVAPNPGPKVALWSKAALQVSLGPESGSRVPAAPPGALGPWGVTRSRC